MRQHSFGLMPIAAVAAFVLFAGWAGSSTPPPVASTTAGPLPNGQPASLSMASPAVSFLEAGGEATQCCFTNSGYAGVCTVEPAKDETCATVLNYLNNPQSQGKTYCNNTSLRGGWKSVACQKPATD